MKNKNFLNTAILMLVSFAVFSGSIFYLFKVKQYDLSDSVQVAGDHVDYQTLAVNMLLGHGFKSGGFENNEIYKFERIEPGNRYMKYFGHRAGKMDDCFYRTPGYPVFLTCVYKCFGIHPKTAKIIQIILFALAVSLLPFIGSYYWKGSGVIAGAITSFIVVKYYLIDPSQIMAETLIIFFLHVFAICLMFWEAKPSLLRGFILGVVSGLGILVKGSVIFIPVFTLIYIVYKYRGPQERIRHCFVYIVGILLFVLPWSIHASQKEGSLVLISTMPQVLLLDSNNEDCLYSGGWMAAWRKENKGSPKYLYNRLKQGDQSSVRKLFFFLQHNSKELPSFVMNKLTVVEGRDCPEIGHARIKTYLPVIGMFMYYLFFGLVSKRRNDITDEKVMFFPLMYFFNILFITLIFYNSIRFIFPFSIFFVLPSVYLCIEVIRLSGVCFTGRVFHRPSTAA